MSEDSALPGRIRNHPNLASPNYTPTSSQFGQVTQETTSNPRTLQAGLRYSF